MEIKSDEELAAAAYVLRKRAELGDREALDEAKRIEAVLRKRLGSTPSGHAPLESEQKPERPWWKFWQQ
jgi:hypothetical protein